MLLKYTNQWENNEVNQYLLISCEINKYGIKSTKLKLFTYLSMAYYN